MLLRCAAHGAHASSRTTDRELRALLAARCVEPKGARGEAVVTSSYYSSTSSRKLLVAKDGPFSWGFGE